MKLYELTAQYDEALKTLSDMNLPQEVVEDTLEALSGEIEEKATNVAKYMENLLADASAIKDAEKKMAARRKVIENRAAHLKEYLKVNMERSGITEVSCPYFQIKIKNNPPSVIIDDLSLVPVKFKKLIPESWAADKSAIKAEIKKNGLCAGAHTEQGTRVDIK